MLTLLATLALTPLTYNMGPATTADYTIQVVFDGFLPVFGGQEGVVSVTLGMNVKGLEPREDGSLRAVSDLTELDVIFKGSKLPFTVDNVKSFFPRNTVALTAEGKIVETDAPDVKLPIRLPGLDVKRFPEITYLPVEFPKAGIEVGKEFQYKKAFGDSTVTYAVTPQEITGEAVTLAVKVKQSFIVLEDEALEVVKEEKDAIAVVTTEVDGAGNIVFDRKLGLVSKLEVKADSTSKVKALKGGKESTRKLSTTLKVDLKKPKA